MNEENDLINVQQIAQQKFSGSDGEILLGWILAKCYFMTDCPPECLSLNNFAKELLVLIYSKEDGTMDNSWFETIKRLLRKRK